MPKHVLLNSVDHKDLKIITERSAEYGDNLWYAPIVTSEFYRVQAHYPILFQLDPENGDYIPVALFGFQNEENLFLQEGRWDAGYIPMSVQRIPFLIGFQNVLVDGVDEQQRVVTLDMDSARVSTEEGVDLFLRFGGNSPYLENISNILETLHQGAQHNKVFIEALKNLNLIESVALDIELNDNSINKLLGFYTINEDVLNELAESEILQLYASGYLRAIHIILSSQAHFQDLIDRKNQKL